MQLQLPSKIDTTAEGGELRFEHGEFAGHKFKFVVKVCPNPCCICSNVDLLFTSEEELGLGPANIPLWVVLNMTEHVITVREPEKSHPVYRLANAISYEIAHAHWQMLNERYLSIKQKITESEDLEQFMPVFPSEIIAGSDLMADYSQILPYAVREFIVEGDHTWFLEDQYCLKPSCTCQECALTFVRMDSVTRKGRHKPITVTGRINLLSGNFTPEPSSAMKQKQALSLFAKLRERCPDLIRTLNQHRAKLRRLLEKVTVLKGVQKKTIEDLPSKIVLPSPGNIIKSETQKVGRNDLCPCGSGKKFKKCCGN